MAEGSGRRVDDNEYNYDVHHRYADYYEYGDSPYFYEQGGNSFHQLEADDPIAAFYQAAEQLYKCRLFVAQGRGWDARGFKEGYYKIFNKLVAGKVDGVKYRPEVLQEHMEELVEQKIRGAEASLPGLNEHAGMFRPLKDK